MADYDPEKIARRLGRIEAIFFPDSIDDDGFEDVKDADDDDGKEEKKTLKAKLQVQHRGVNGPSLL